MIEFASHPGYAHVIEDEEMFPKNFAEVRSSIKLFPPKILEVLMHMICCINML